MLFASLAFCFSLLLPGVYAQSSYKLVGEIRIENPEAEMIPSFKLYFDGKELSSDSAGLYTITLQESDVANGRLDNFSLMICKELDVEFTQGHTPNTIRLKNLPKCLWYKLDREWRADKKKYEWDIKQQTIGENDCVPESCLVLITSATNVEEVSNDSHIADTVQGVDGILPSIVLKTDDSRRSAQSAIASIDLRMHTEPQRYDTLVQNGVECKIYR